MPDIFVLSMMARPLLVEGVKYYVAWDTELNRARIVFPYPTGETTELVDLTDENGNEMSFGTELDAHRYLIGLKIESEDDSWRDL